MWTIDELVERVGEALAAEYPGAPNGRVRDVPDRRAVRWYTTTGLVDRPTAMRGRTALYGHRHLLQLVALKRRQAAGYTLAEIQAELTGATDPALAEIARLPVPTPADSDQTAAANPARTRFWAQPGPPVPAAAPARPPDPATPPLNPATPTTAAPLAGVDLGDGVVLLVPGQPGTADYAAIAAAARPLLDLLATRGLTTGVRATHTARRPPSDTDGDISHRSAPRTDRSRS